MAKLKHIPEELSAYRVTGNNIDELLNKIIRKEKDPELLVIDLFCGAGGTSTGFANTDGRALVIACVNHDKNAINSHWENYPYVAHFEEDIRTLNLSPLVRLLNYYKKLYPNAKIVLWASLECTNFSKAKGGQPRDADSRTLADHIFRYLEALNPDYLMIENVVEFMSWGPLDENGKPVSRRSGSDFMRWCREVDDHGYFHEWKELNSADFGAYTSRNRLFGMFAKQGLPIMWPNPTHIKRGKKAHAPSLFGTPLKSWKAVKDVLDFTDEGKSIFERNKPLSDKTLERIYAGLIKFVAGGKDNFLAKTYAVASNGDGVYNTDGPAHTITTRDGHHIVNATFLSTYNGGNAEFRNKSVDEPCKTLTTCDAHAVVNASYITKYYSGKPEGKNISIDGPAGTITTIDGQALVQTFIVQRNTDDAAGRVIDIDGPARTLTSTAGNQDMIQAFISTYHGNGDNVSSIDNPCPTIPTKDSHAVVQPVFIMRDFSNGGESSSVNTPLGAILPSPKANMVTTQPFIMPTNYNNEPRSIDEPCPTVMASRKHHYLVNPSWSGNNNSIEEPCPVLIARQDKSPLYITICDETGHHIAIRLDDGDSPIMLKIKDFMVLYRIVDIKMRMLKIPELLSIQGFPSCYKLRGTQTEQKKYIGNSVVPVVVQHMAIRIMDEIKNVA